MSGCLRKHLCYCTDCGKELAKKLRGRRFRDCVVNKVGQKKIPPVEKTTSKCYVCGADDPTCTVLHGSTYDHTNADSFSHTSMFREHTCYCQICACKEFAEALAEKRKLRCPVCQREADRIIVKDAADDGRVPTLRRCKSAVTIREKLEEEILGMHRAEVPSQQVPPSGIGAEKRRHWIRIFALRKYMEALSAFRRQVDAILDYSGAEVQLQKESWIGMAVERGQSSIRSFTLRRYVEALSAFKKLVDALSDYCGAEIQLQQETSSQTVEEGKQNLQTCSVMGLCEEAMSALEKIVEELLGICDAEIPGHQESTSQTVADGRQNTKRGGLTEHTRQNTKSVFRKLKKAILTSTAVATPVRQAPVNQTVVQHASSVGQAPLLQKCESATFSWDKKCPFCRISPDANQESKYVFLFDELRCTPVLLHQAPLLLYGEQQEDCQDAKRRGNTRVSFPILSKACRSRDYECCSLEAKNCRGRDQ